MIPLTTTSTFFASTLIESIATEKTENNDLFNSFISKRDKEQLDSLKGAVQQDKVVVTCMGLYNHGKSTLLNALINDLEQETFKTTDVRETTENKIIEQEKIIFVDTPGLNATEHDDKRVMDVIKKSDINLFVHTITTGEFTEKEMEFFHKVKKYWKDPQEFIERTIFVISRIDTANDEGDIEATSARMKEQIQDVFSSDAIFVPVSALRYIKGMKDEKNIIVKKSNLEQLHFIINELSKKHWGSIKETRKLRLKQYYSDLIKYFNAKLQEKKLQLSELKRVSKKIKNDIARTEKTLLAKYEKLEEEL